MTSMTLNNLFVRQMIYIDRSRFVHLKTTTNVSKDVTAHLSIVCLLHDDKRQTNSYDGDRTMNKDKHVRHGSKVYADVVTNSVRTYQHTEDQ
jgi:hypothetical protein